jgi:hypothetical protein
MKMNVNPDTMNFYMCMGYQYHQIPNVDTNGFWMFNFMSQVLPKQIKFVANYNYIIPKGNYFISLRLSLSEMLWFKFF